MKKVLITLSFVCGVFLTQAQEFKVITVVESIVPGGAGRSRIIETQSELNVDDFTTERTDGKKSGQKDIKRSGAKVQKFEESNF